MASTKTVLATATVSVVRIDDLVFQPGVPTPIPDDPAFIARLKGVRGVVIQDVITETTETSQTTTTPEL